MSAPLHKTAQMQFELHKDDKRVQALLTLLGRLQEHVSDWRIDANPESTTYQVVFQDGKEMRGFIIPIPEQYDWQHCEWIASGTMLPAEVAKEIRWKEQKEASNG